MALNGDVESMRNPMATAVPLSLGFRVSAVLPAGGTGTRVGISTPKQYWPIYGKPLLFYTLEVFESIPWLSEVIVPVSEDAIAELQKDIAEWKFTKTRAVLGSSTRHRSIRSGVIAASSPLSQTSTMHDAVNLINAGSGASVGAINTGSPAAGAPDVIIVHDIVRPFVDEDILRKVSIAALEHGAAGAILPLVSTVVMATADGFLDHSLDRTKYRASQTPQAFRTEVIRTAYDKCTDYDFEYGTECLHIALEYANARAKLIEGTPLLWKVTHKPDIYAAEHMIKERLRSVAIVTGGGRGIGEAVARGLSDRGMKVAVVARTHAEVASVAEKIRGLPIVADVSKVEDVARVFRTVYEAFGRIDVLVNNAGSAIHARIEDMTDDQWASLVSGNLSSTFYCSREAMRAMRTGGRGGVIVNVGSSSVSGGRVGEGAYSATKAGIQCLTETLALEGRPHNVFAYCVVPRRTATQLRRDLYPNEDSINCLAPEDVAQTIVGVATEWTPWLTGHAFWVK